LPQRKVPPDRDQSASPRPDAEMLLAQGGAALLGRQALRPGVSQVLPLAAAAEAHRILERRHASGKIILDVLASRHRQFQQRRRGTALIRAHRGERGTEPAAGPGSPRGFLPLLATACAGAADRVLRL
jgi:Zinc-binding dehydrogenase